MRPALPLLGACLAALLPVLASAQPSIHAVRTTAAPEIDGRLDDAVWAQATPFTDFVQSYPDEGAAPTERTELRILYDDRFLYVAVHLFDSQPERIQRTLGRRDNPPSSDSVRVAIDSIGDRRTAYSFSITAGKVKQDGLFTADVRFSPEWDQVWSADAALLADGWSAELAIPLHLLRFTPAEVQRWNLHVHRVLPRRHEEIDSALVPRTGNRFVSLFNPLEGLTDLEPHQSVELLPYAAARLSLAPQYEDAALPSPRLLNPSGDLGVDLNAQLASSLNLVATVNPDFGQVEADQLILNLGTTEAYFGEKRPFFTQGLDLFVPVGEEVGSTPQRIFYSRRIGLGTPILGAAKLTGTAPGGVDFGILDALVMGPVNPSRVTPPDEDPLPQDAPDRRVAWNLERPLHLGVQNELPAHRPVTKNYFALVARKRLLNESSRVGAYLTDVTPLSKRCYREDFVSDADFEAADCEASGERVAAADFDVRTADRLWGAWGQLAGSQITGRSRPVTLRDGTTLGPGDTGMAGYVRAGKLAGEPFRIFAQYDYTSPRFDSNQAGFVATQNVQTAWAQVGWVRSEPVGFLRDLSIAAWGGRDFTTDGRFINRGNFTGVHAEALFPGFNVVGVECGVESAGFDVREISEEDVPYEKSPDWYCAAGVSSDKTKPLFAVLNLFRYQNLPRGEVLVKRAGYSADLQTTFRPMPALETNVVAHYEVPALTARFLERTDDTLLFAGLVAPYVSVTLRQQWVLTPELTLQAYAQLFAASGHYAPYYVADYRGPGVAVTMDDLRSAGFDRSAEDDFRQSALNVNVVLRWEYRLGSTLYAVYTRSQGNYPFEGTAKGLALTGLGRGPATDTVMVKWSYFFGR